MRNIVAGSSLFVAMLILGPALVAQKGPAPVSTALYDAWTPEKLSTPGSLGNFGNHNASIQRREVGNPAEAHDGFAHILMFTGGQGTFVIGGELADGPDGKKVIRGGDTHKVAPGVVYHIPAKVPHWVRPDAGSPVTYFVANVNVEKSGS
jgi:mannose-6-phosphate isomerase-like protein (cupin superfamily)